jgi:hypothetical protein
MTKVCLIHVIMGTAFSRCSGQIVCEMDEGIRLEFPSRDAADAFKHIAQSIGQIVVELQ